MFENNVDEHANSIIKEVVNLFINIIIELRPRQWFKNLLVFIGIIFSLNFFHLNLWINVILSFIAFCLLSGSVYIINDVLDRKADSLHPVKRNRPIASGKLNPRIALVISIALMIIALMIAFYLGIIFVLVSCAYVVLTLFYNFLLKNIYLVDILTISTGFVIRAVAGCVAISVAISPWLILCTFLGSLYLALGKRRHELILLKDTAGKHRRVLSMYSIPVLDSFIGICTSTLIVSYSMYTFFSGHIYMMATIPFVIYGLFRYTDYIYNMKICGEPELIFKDTHILVDILLWGLVVIFVLLNMPDTIILYLNHL